MMNKSFVLIMFLFMMLMSCGNKRAPTPIPSASRSAWLAKFLEHPACQPPCWENITPGKTTIEEAKMIIMDKTDIEISYQDREVIEWEFLPNHEGGKVDSYGGEVINYTHFSIRTKQALRIHELVNTFGEPTFLSFSRSRFLDSCDVDMAFESLGMVLSTIQACQISKTQDGKQSIHISIDKDILIDSFTLSSRGAKELIGVESPDDMSIWNGYGEYIRVFND